MKRIGKESRLPDPRARAPQAAGPVFALLDAHCHLDHMGGAEELAQAALAQNIGICCATVTPAEFRAARKRFQGLPNVCVGAGLHPWWLADGRATGDDVDALVLQVTRTPFVAEVGLDFSGPRAASASVQLAALESVAEACATWPVAGRVLSLHAVRAADDVLSILERYDLARNAACIFHWFSGTSDELVRARRAGCYFSVNARMLESKRGRAYAQAVPAGRLLLETDAPAVFDEPLAFEEWHRELEGALTRLAALRGTEPEALAEEMAATAGTVFSACFTGAEEGRSEEEQA